MVALLFSLSQSPVHFCSRFLVDNAKKKKQSKQPPSLPKTNKKKKKELLPAVVGKKPQKILHYNSNTKWKSLLLSAPLMPPNQHVMGRCNQIISLRFGFPNSFPKLPSAHRSLAFRTGGEGGEVAWSKRFLGKLEQQGDERLSDGVEEGRLIFLTRKPAEREGEIPLFPPSLNYFPIYSSSSFTRVCVTLEAHPQMTNSWKHTHTHKLINLHLLFCLQLHLNDKWLFWTYLKASLKFLYALF